jgi:hypothetical protein
VAVTKVKDCRIVRRNHYIAVIEREPEGGIKHATFVPFDTLLRAQKWLDPQDPEQHLGGWEWQERLTLPDTDQDDGAPPPPLSEREQYRRDLMHRQIKLDYGRAYGTNWGQPVDTEKDTEEDTSLFFDE